MTKARTYHLPTSTAPVYIGIECLDQIGASGHGGTDIAVSNITEPGGQR